MLGTAKAVILPPLAAEARARVAPKNGRTPAVIVSVAHLDEEERALVLGVLLEEVLSWVRGLSGSERLKALVVFDEVYGFLPPHPANPPTKRPIVALMKQARAFGVGVVVATQNPMDLDYRALSNAGVWCIGRLQTDADRARVLDGLAGASQKGEDSEAEVVYHQERSRSLRWPDPASPTSNHVADARTDDAQRNPASAPMASVTRRHRATAKQHRATDRRRRDPGEHSETEGVRIRQLGRRLG